MSYDGRIYEQQFNVGVAAAGELESAGPPLTVAKAGGDQYHLSWGESCKSSDSDYVIYEGSIGDFTSHTRVTCSTSGEKSWTVTSVQPNRYWLAGPRNASREGGLGANSAGTPRPQPALVLNRCLTRLFDCN